MITIYKSLDSPCLEYASHVLGGSTHTALLNRVESKAIRLINSSPLTDCLQPLKVRRNAASFALSYRYYHAHRSFHLATCMHPPHSRPRCTRIYTRAYHSAIRLPTARVNRHFHYFLLFAGELWDRLPFSVFLSFLEVTLSRGEYQDTSGTKTDYCLSATFPAFFFFIGAAFFSTFLPLACLAYCTKMPIF